MSKIHEYIKLLKKQRAAKRAMLAAEQKITSFHKEYALNKSENADVSACINRFEVVYDAITNVRDDGGYVKKCALFDELPCADRKCPMFAANLDYTIAKERYDAAVAARRAFMRNLRGARTK